MNFKYFDSLVDAAFVIDADFKLHYGNPAFAQICGVSARRLNKADRLLSDFITIQDSFFKSPEELVEVSDQSMYREVEFSAESGTKGWCQFTAQKVAEPTNANLWLVYLRDVTLEKSLHDKYRAQLEAKEQVIEQLREAQRELKLYSENLEEMVAARTRELSEALALQTATLDSLGQGFFIFDESGICAPYYSKVCPQMFGTPPEGRQVVDVLQLKDETAAIFKKWIATTFLGTLPFEDMCGLLPLQELQIGDTILELQFYPMEDAQGKLQSIVTVATDVTAQRAAERELEREKKFAKMIHTILKHQKQFISFTRDALNMVDWLTNDYPEVLLKDTEEFFRVLHTLKGGAATFSMEDVANRITEAEVHFKEIQISESSTDALKADEPILMGCAELFRQTLDSISSLLNLNWMVTSRRVDIPVETLYQWYRRLQSGESSNVLAGEMRDQYLFEDVSHLLGHLGNEAQRLAQLLGKKIQPVRVGPEGFRLFPEPYEPLLATLIHFLRNSMDHGIEDPDLRRESGKPPEGRIEICFEKISRQGLARLMITMRDDGAGIHIEALREKLKSRPSTVSDLNQLSPTEILQMVFEDGVSTRSTANSISGMGVGMSAIRSEARKLGGEATIESEPGQGTTLRIDVPWVETMTGQTGSITVAKSA